MFDVLGVIFNLSIKELVIKWQSDPLSNMALHLTGLLSLSIMFTMAVANRQELEAPE